MIEAFTRIDDRIEGKVSAGIPTGFKDLDSLTGGFHDSELIIVAARPSMGKSALAANIAEHAAIEESVPTLFVSLEMGRMELADRLLGSHARIASEKLRAGTLSIEDRRSLMDSQAEIARSPLHIDDTPTRTCTEIAAVARRLKRKKGLRLLIIDYLQLIQPDNPRDVRQEQVAKMSRRLKGIARELKIPVICVAQLNRQADSGKDGHRPRLSQLRESGAIEQDADVVLFVHREEYYCNSREEAREKGICGQAELIVAKQRNGATGEIKATWTGKYFRFEEGQSGQKSNEEFSEFSGM
jgi:replicative DNA helicase